MTKVHDPTVLHDEREALERASDAESLFDTLPLYFSDPEAVVDNPVPKKASKALSTAEIKRRMK